MTNNNLREVFGDNLWKLLCDDSSIGAFRPNEISLITQLSKSCLKTGEEFHSYPKIPRYSNETFTISEKIDGSNGVIKIDEVGNIIAGSRTQWLVGLDAKGRNLENHGFRQFVADNHDELLKLGVGTHYGEWYGSKINRNYGLDHNKFMLFNRNRYEAAIHKQQTIESICPGELSNPDDLFPACVTIETILCDNISFDELSYAVANSLDALNDYGSAHVQGFMKPEGLIVRSNLRGTLYKVIID